MSKKYRNGPGKVVLVIDGVRNPIFIDHAGFRQALEDVNDDPEQDDAIFDKPDL